MQRSLGILRLEVYERAYTRCDEEGFSEEIRRIYGVGEETVAYY
jgi:hypothetical protein